MSGCLSQLVATSPERCRRGFTLIELLITLGVLAILAALLLPVLTRAKESGRSTACLSNLRQVGLALQIYVDEHDNRMPTMFDALVSTNTLSLTNQLATIDVVLSNHLGNVAVLRCPSDDKKLFTLTGSSYAWNSLLNGQSADHLKLFTLSLDPHQIPLVFDKESFHRARGAGRAVNFLYADGHIHHLLAIEGSAGK